MRNFILIVSASAVLSGCALVDAFKMSRWDNNEYKLANEIQTQAQLGSEHCGSKDVWLFVNKVYVKSRELKNYSAGLQRNQEATKMTSELFEIVKGLRERYTSGEEVSQKYCELKFSNVETSADLIKRSLGSKPR